MTTIDPDVAQAPTPLPLVVEVDGIPMSALLAEVPQPRAVVLALHGGSTTAKYFDFPGRPRLSLLRTGAALGYTVLALDRPGYGSSAPYADMMTSPARRLELAVAAVDRLLTARPQGAGVFVVAHSAGCELGTRMAVAERAVGLLGIELGGAGLEHPPDALRILQAMMRDGATANVRNLLWRPAEHYPAEVVGGRLVSFPAPAYERGVVDTWATRDFRVFAAQVRVPVQFSLGDHEMVWLSGPTALADIGSMFTASPRVATNEQADSGHNLSLGHTAMAYHLRVLSFVEECIQNAEFDSRTTQVAGHGPAREANW